MPRPTDSEARKKRDSAILTQDQAIADHLAQAYRVGELQSAPSFGKPLSEPEGWTETPTEFRLPFKILKNASAPPREVELFRKRAAIRQALLEASGQDERQELMLQLSEIEQVIALRLEGMRASGRL